MKLFFRTLGKPYSKMTTVPSTSFGNSQGESQGTFSKEHLWRLTSTLIDVSLNTTSPTQAAGHSNNKNINKRRSWRHWQTESRPCWWLSFWVLSGEAGCLSLGRNILYHHSFDVADGLDWVQGLSMETSKGLPRGKCQSWGLVKSSRNWWVLSGRMYTRCMMATGWGLRLRGCSGGIRPKQNRVYKSISYSWHRGEWGGSVSPVVILSLGEG